MLNFPSAICTEKYDQMIAFERILLKSFRFIMGKKYGVLFNELETGSKNYCEQIKLLQTRIDNVWWSIYIFTKYMALIGVIYASFIGVRFAYRTYKEKPNREKKQIKGQIWDVGFEASKFLVKCAGVIVVLQLISIYFGHVLFAIAILILCITSLKNMAFSRTDSASKRVYHYHRGNENNSRTSPRNRNHDHNHTGGDNYFNFGT